MKYNTKKLKKKTKNVNTVTINYLFMAFATSNKESVESTFQYKNYIGISPVTLLAVNPNKAELEKIYGREFENEPTYVSMTKEYDGKPSVQQVRLDFIVKTDPTFGNQIDYTSKVTFFLNNEYRYNRDKTKVQVINKYGETTWLSIEDYQNKNIPSNLSFFSPSGMRPCYVGEEDLTAFIKAYLNIPSRTYRNKAGQLVQIENVADAEAQLEQIPNYFSGNITELKNIIAVQPTWKVKVLFGVRNTDDGKQYQTTYNRFFVKNGSSYYVKLQDTVQADKDRGAYPNTEFEFCNLKEYNVVPTEFKETKVEDDSNPFASLPTVSTPSVAPADNSGLPF